MNFQWISDTLCLSLAESYVNNSNLLLWIEMYGLQ
jgi:hypothetical protein